MRLERRGRGEEMAGVMAGCLLGIPARGGRRQGRAQSENAEKQAPFPPESKMSQAIRWEIYYQKQNVLFPSPWCSKALSLTGERKLWSFQERHSLPGDYMSTGYEAVISSPRLQGGAHPPSLNNSTISSRDPESSQVARSRWGENGATSR